MSKDYSYVVSGLKVDKSNIWLWSIITGAVLVIGAFLYGVGNYYLLKVNPEITKQGADIFLKYLFIVVAAERAAAVFVSMFRSQNKIDWNLRIKRINEVLSAEEPAIQMLKQVYSREERLVAELEKEDFINKIERVPVAPAVPEAEDYIGFLTSAKFAYEFQRARFNSISGRYVTQVVFIAGIVLAMLGISLFDDLIKNLDGLKTKCVFQASLLRGADILITGGLLGGGSAGLNMVANKVTEFLDRGK